MRQRFLTNNMATCPKGEFPAKCRVSRKWRKNWRTCLRGIQKEDLKMCSWKYHRSARVEPPQLSGNFPQSQACFPGRLWIPLVCFLWLEECRRSKAAGDTLVQQRRKTLPGRLTQPGGENANFIFRKYQQLRENDTNFPPSREPCPIASG